jgi:hypothetical protein
MVEPLDLCSHGRWGWDRLQVVELRIEMLSFTIYDHLG